MTTMISEAGLGWIAGILDGEGCIYIGRSHQLEVKVTNCDRLIIDRLRVLAGGRIDYPDGRIDLRSPNNSLWYSWNIGGKQAVALLERVLPLLTGKRAQALLAVEFGATILPRGKRLSPELHQRREELRVQLRVLKGRIAS